MIDYTIDVSDRGGPVKWRLYNVGGTVNLANGSSASLETALDVARMKLLQHHRTGEISGGESE